MYAQAFQEIAQREYLHPKINQFGYWLMSQYLVIIFLLDMLIINYMPTEVNILFIISYLFYLIKPMFEKFQKLLAKIEYLSQRSQSRRENEDPEEIFISSHSDDIIIKFYVIWFGGPISSIIAYRPQTLLTHPNSFFLIFLTRKIIKMSSTSFSKIFRCQFHYFIYCKMQPKKQWKEQQKQLLRELYPRFSSKKWKMIASEMMEKGFKRNQIQCREKWINFLDPEINKNEWSTQELQKLYQLYEKYGARWCYIQKELKRQRLQQKRSQNKIKNRFYGTLRNYIRQIINVVCEKESHFSSQISKVLPNTLNELYNSQNVFDFLNGEIRKMIFRMQFQIDKKTLLARIKKKYKLYNKLLKSTIILKTMDDTLNNLVPFKSEKDLCLVAEEQDQHQDIYEVKKLTRNQSLEQEKMDDQMDEQQERLNVINEDDHQNFDQKKYKKEHTVKFQQNQRLIQNNLIKQEQNNTFPPIANHNQIMNINNEQAAAELMNQYGCQPSWHSTNLQDEYLIQSIKNNYLLMDHQQQFQIMYKTFLSNFL